MFHCNPCSQTLGLLLRQDVGEMINNLLTHRGTGEAASASAPAPPPPPVPPAPPVPPVPAESMPPAPPPTPSTPAPMTAPSIVPPPPPCTPARATRARAPGTPGPGSTPDLAPHAHSKAAPPRPPSPSSSINDLEDQDHGSEANGETEVNEELTCTFCMDVLNPAVRRQTALVCGHVFHVGCLARWRRVAEIATLHHCPFRCHLFKPRPIDLEEDDAVVPDANAGSSSDLPALADGDPAPRDSDADVVVEETTVDGTPDDPFN